ncbi:MAG: hypothetical protein KC620_03560 [Myxococcales bacterium]|nr:hypothetical protein [Myxococcales bacterium]
MRSMLYVAALCAAAMLGCNAKTETPAAGPAGAAPTAAEPQAPARAPVQSAIVKGANGQPTAMAPSSQPTGAMPAGHPPTGAMPVGHPPTGEMPAGHPPTGGMPAMPGGGSIAGSITLSPEQKDKVKAGSVLFIIVRKDEGEGARGMLIAAKKIPVTGPEMFPVAYSVTDADVMMQGSALAGSVRVEARVDQDGDAISKAPGDVIGAHGKGVQVGATGIDFTLDQSL